MPFSSYKDNNGRVLSQWFFDLPSINREVGIVPWVQHPHNPQLAESPLCQTCQHLNFSFVSSHVLGGEKGLTVGEKRLLLREPPIVLCNVAELENRAQCCHFCRLVWTAFCSQRSQATMKELAHSNRQVGLSTFEFDRCGIVSEALHPGRPIAPAPRITIEISIAGSRMSEIGEIIVHYLANEELVYLGLDDEATGIARVIDTHTDVSLLQSWLHTCSMSHGGHEGPCPSRFEHHPITTKFIDVQNYCVVEGSTGDTSYAALSYCWGNSTCVLLEKSTIKTLMAVKGLLSYRDVLPQTILDSIELCRKLGIRFLWVDGMCIQQDTGDKIRQIQGMHSIYAGAYVTLVAAAGTNADFGLAGITKRSSPQHAARVNGIVFTTLLREPTNTVESSTWNSRGWTYQERLLSERSLIFTEEQVIFSCRHFNQIRESMRFDPHTITEDLSCVMRMFENYSLNTHEVVDFDTYATMVIEYSDRALTAESDILHALQGLLNVVASSFTQPKFAFGLPVHLLDIALLWRPARPLRRRKGWPSWSWTGWVGGITYATLIDSAERTKHLFEPVASKSSDRECPEDTMQSWTRHCPWDDGIHYTRNGGDPNKWHCRPDRAVTFETLISDDGVLHVQGKMARLRVARHIDTNHRHELGHGASWATSARVNAVRTIVVDAASIHIGTIIIDANTASNVHLGVYRFLRLNSTTLTFRDMDPAWDEDTCTYVGAPGDKAVNPQDNFRVDDRGIPCDNDDAAEGGGTDQDAWFDPSVYNHNLCWCLYDVLMLNEDDERIGVGKIHIHAFDAVSEDATVDVR